MNEEMLEKLKNWCAEKNWVLHVVESNKDRNRFVRSGKGLKHIYGLIADGKVELLGEGVRARSDLMFRGFAVPGHLRAISMACLYHRAEAITRFVVVPESSDHFLAKEATECENYLHGKTGFKVEKLEDKNNRICDNHINQLIAEGEITRKAVDSDVFKVLMFTIQNASGTDARTYKKLVGRLKLQSVAEASATIKKIINGYYNNI